MSELKKNRKYNFWHSPIALLILFLILVLFVYNMVDLIEKERNTSRNKAVQLNKLEELKSRESSLIRDIDKLKSDDGVEASIRDKFQVAKPGEKAVIIIDENKPKDFNQSENIDHTFWHYISKWFNKK